MLSQLFQFLSVVTAISICCHAKPWEKHLTKDVKISLRLSQSQLSPATPDFLHATYECWSSKHSLKHCTPFPARSALDDVNIVQAIKGTVYEEATGVQYHFNTSVLQTQWQHMYIRLTKEGLTVEESTSVQKKCKLSNDVLLTLNMKLYYGDAVSATFKDTLTINIKDITEKTHVNFTGLSQAFSDSLRNEEEKPSRVSFDLSIGGSCHNVLTPTDLGFNDHHEPWLVTYSIQLDSDRPKRLNRFSKVIREAKNTHYARMQADAGNETGDILSEESEIDITRPCRMYPLRISLLELIDGERYNLVKPKGVYINQCLGVCSFPLISYREYNTTKHSMIQSIAAQRNPDYVPPPCCSPHNYTVVEVMLYDKISGSLKKQTIDDLAVNSCGCK